MENINKYLQAEGGQLALEQERYGSAYRAIICHRSACDFIFDALEGDDIEGTEIQSFFWENALFPTATGNTVQDAILNLNVKLADMYSFEASSNVKKWRAIPRFVLKAAFDCESGEEPTFYNVSWLDIINDLQEVSSPYFYDEAKGEASPTHRRDLHALLNFDYSGQFKALR